MIKLDVKVERLIQDVKDLKDGFAARIAILETSKTDKVEAERVNTALNDLIDKTDAETRLDLSKDIALLQKIVYGGVSFILIGFVGSVLTLVFNK